MRMNCTLEDFFPNVWFEHKKQTEIICRFADAVTMLTYIDVMIPEAVLMVNCCGCVWVLTSELLPLTAEPMGISCNVVSPSSLFRLFLSRCHYHPYIYVNTPSPSGLTAGLVCECLYVEGCLTVRCELFLWEKTRSTSAWLRFVILPVSTYSANKGSCHSSLFWPAVVHLKSLILFE